MRKIKKGIATIFEGKTPTAPSKEGATPLWPSTLLLQLTDAFVP
jgi:hypothetical protein